MQEQNPNIKKINRRTRENRIKALIGQKKKLPVAASKTSSPPGCSSINGVRS